MGASRERGTTGVLRIAKRGNEGQVVRHSQKAADEKPLKIW